MTRAIVGVCTIELELPDVESVGQKRAIIGAMLKRIRLQHNASSAEIDQQDSRDSAVIAVSVVSNSSQQVNAALTRILNWIDEHYSDVLVVNETIEIL